MSEPGSSHLVPPDAGRFQLGMSANDALGNLRGKKLGVCGVGHGAQEVVHHARGAVGVGCRNEDPVGRDAGGFRGQLLCLIADGSRDHAAVDDGDRDTYLASLKNEATGLEIPRIHFAAPTLGKAPADQKGVKGPGNVLNVGSGAQLLFGDLGRCGPGEEEGE